MYKITKKLKLADKTYMVSLQCPNIAKAIKPGQFVLIRITDKSQCIPFDYNGGGKKDIQFVFEENEYTKPLVSMKKGNEIYEIVGPLGVPTNLKNYTTICMLGSGSGIASIYTLAKQIKSRHNRIIAILGADTKKKLYWEDKMDKVANHMFVSTIDGSKGRKGTLDIALKDILKKRLDLIYVASDSATMRQISKMTNNYVKTIAKVKVPQLDSFGISGCDRVFLEDQVKLCSLDGPDFDAHDVQWDLLHIRENPYIDKETIFKSK